MISKKIRQIVVCQKLCEKKRFNEHESSSKRCGQFLKEKKDSKIFRQNSLSQNPERNSCLNCVNLIKISKRIVAILV